MVRSYVAARREEIRLEAGKGVVDAFCYRLATTRARTEQQATA
ncbi:hypothetical protein [Streptomyces sp. NPDC057565]